MKTVLYIGKYNGIIGGIERYIEKSAQLLRNNGFAVHYLYTNCGGKDQENFASAFDSIQKFTPENGLLKTAGIVILHNIISVEFMPFMPAGKTFFFAHDHNIYCQRHHYYWPVGRINCNRKYNKLVCKVCSLCRNEAPPLAEYRKLPALVLSDFMAENLRKNGFEKVTKLPAFIRAGEGEHNFMPDGVLRILFLGQLIRGKGADLMIKSLAGLDIPFECTVAGDGKDRAMLEDMVKKFKLDDKVRFAGFVSEPENLWQNCDLFCFPIRWQEPFGLVGLEAMAHGVPVAAFDLGGVREWLTDTENGYAVPEGTDMGRVFRLVYQQHDVLLPEMSRCCFASIREKFSEEKFISKFNELFEVLK